MEIQSITPELEEKGLRLDKVLEETAAITPDKNFKGEVEKILQENHTSKENRLAFANGVIYALANVTTGLKGKERFLRDYTEGILHAAYVLYEKKMSLEK